jgi:hypothetical protein
MTEPAPVADEAYLKELEDVTRRYAKYAYGTVGLANVPAGLLWIAAGIAFRGGKPAAAQVLVVFSVPLMLAIAGQVRHWYQRHGAARPQPEASLTSAWVCSALGVVVVLLQILKATNSGSLLPRPTSGLLYLLCSVLTGALLWPDRRRPRQLWGPLNLLWLSLSFGAMDPELAETWLPGFGIAQIAVGLVAHWDSLRLERRLAKLKSMARPA